LPAFPTHPGPLHWTLPVLLAIAVFLPLISAPLLLDERVLFFEARKFIALDPLAPWQLPLGGSGSWRPLLSYVYWLDSGAPAWASHALNLGLYALLVAGLWRWLCCRLPRTAATVGAALFAAHGAHVANAGWVAGRADLLMTLAVVGALLAWEGRRGLLCVLAACAAVLFKETGVVVVPLLALLALADGEGLRRHGRLFALVACAVLPLFGLSVSLAEVAPSYWPSPTSFDGGALLLLPAFALELIAPLFRPIGLGYAMADLLGALAALVLAAVFVTLARGCARRNTWLLGLGMAAISLLPVLHVLGNDGGQWYLLLPSLGISLSWAALVGDGLPRGGLPRRAQWFALIALFAVFSCWQSLQWRVASQRVEAVVSEARRVSAESGADAVQQPPVQEPRQWPHMGPSFCCGLPYQVLEELPQR
jgi:hypothetical protein